MSLLVPLSSPAENEGFVAERLPSIPDPEGFAGAFAGVSGGALIVAGGANIAGNNWEEPLQKQFYASAFVLESPAGTWRTGFSLPHPLGYGVAVTCKDGVACLGGSDGRTHFTDAFLLVWKDGALQRKALPDLPEPCANACGALVGRTLYVAGGLGAPTASDALRTFWALDLEGDQPSWQVLEPCPGPGRMLAVSGVFDGAFYLFSGTALAAGPDGQPVRRYLQDAWRYGPGSGWQRLADLPRPAVAAPSPAPSAGGQLWVLSGDDGRNVNFRPVEEHPGFPHTALAYDPAADRWTVGEGVPFSRATTPAVAWEGRIVIPNGEVRPRVRTPEVWALSLR